MIRILNLSGDPLSIGRQHGEQVLDLRPQIAASMEARLSAVRQRGINLAPYLDEITRVWEQHASTTLQMLQSMAETLGFDWSDFLSYTATSYLTDRLNLPDRSAQWNEGCTAWAASRAFTRDGAPLLAKNRDNQPDQRPLQCLAHVHPKQGHPYLGLTTAGTPGVSSSGINAVGLAVADTYVSSTDVGPGIGRYSVMMDLLEKCSSVQEATEYAYSHPHLGNGTLCLADAKGDLAVFELAHFKQAVRHPHTGFVVSTNHFEAPATRELWIDHEPPGLRGTSMRRYDRVEGALTDARGRIDAGWAQHLMALHGSDLEAICRHAEIDSEGITVSSVIFLPQEAAMHLANGYPCTAPYERFKVVDRPTSALGSPSA